MAQPIIGGKYLSDWLEEINNPGPNTNFDVLGKSLKTYLSTGGGTQDQIKPLLDALSSKGYSLDLNSGAVKLPTQGQAGQIIQPTTTPIDTGAKIPGTEIPVNSDRGQIETESQREGSQGLDVLQKQLDARTGGLKSLGDILNAQNQAQFNYDLPNIKEQLQGEGVYQSPSALANAVARESSMLGANTTSQLAQYGLGNIDLQTQGLGSILQNQMGMQQGGLQRQFSVGDYEKQANLAREIGAASVPQSPGTFSNVLSSGMQGAAAGLPFGAPGVGVGATLGLVNGMAKGGGK